MPTPVDAEMNDPTYRQQQRIDALEFKVAHLEHAVQELSDVIYGQQRRIDELLQINRQVLQQLAGLEDKGADPNAVEIPPHY